jgi:protein dithiol:quinone oxidoreductase
MSQTPKAPRYLTVAALLSLAAVAAALVTQHQLGMQPCQWCVLQRLQFIVIALLAGAAAGAAVLRMQLLSRGLALFAALMALGGVAAALWQHFVAASSDSCKRTLADVIVRDLGLDELLPSVFTATASCSEKAKLLGLPYEWFSLAAFVLVGTAAVLAARGAFRPR